MILYALFETIPEARRAVRCLAERGIRHEQISICCDSPLPVVADPQLLPLQKRRTRIPWLALIGGGVGAALGYGMPAVTAHWMGLPTGGQPIISLWAFGIIIFELLALGAIGATLLTFLWETGLPCRRKAGEEEFRRALLDGEILLLIALDSPKDGEDLLPLLEREGAKRLKIV